MHFLNTNRFKTRDISGPFSRAFSLSFVSSFSFSRQALSISSGSDIMVIDHLRITSDDNHICIEAMIAWI